MNILLWVLQVVLAMVFLAHAGLFLFPPENMVAAMNASIPLPRTPDHVGRAGGGSEFQGASHADRDR